MFCLMTIRDKWHLNVWLLFVFEIMTLINILLQSNDIHRRPCNLKAICGLLALDSVSGMLYRVQWLRKMWWIVEMKMNRKIKFYCGMYWKFERLQHAKHSNYCDTCVSSLSNILLKSVCSVCCPHGTWRRLYALQGMRKVSSWTGQCNFSLQTPVSLWWKLTNDHIDTDLGCEGN